MLKKRLRKNQKGLSAIVSTLMIILLVLVAVGIIWVVVRGIIQEGAEGIELGKFTLDLEIKAAQIENGDVTVVVVRRNPGEGNFVGMNFIFSDGTNSEIIRNDTVLQELEERRFTFTLTEISTDNLETISVAPIFELSSGKESVGNVADSFEVTDEMKAGITGGAVSNFAALGFTGAGMREYTISSQSEEVVKFTKVVVDPLDVLPGDNQTFTAYVTSPNGITNVTTVTELDNETLNLDLELQEDGSWSATWTVYDTHTTTYKTIFTAWDTLGNSGSIGLTWTDSCQSSITHGTDSTISTTCNTGDSTIAGIDGASLTIAQDTTLTIDDGSFFAFNQGESITIIASGARIASTSTGSFGNAYLFYTDVDEDGYTPSTVMTYSASSSLSQKVRASSLLGTDDCQDNNDDMYRNVSSISFDFDQDGYTYVGNSPSTECVGVSSSISGRTYYWGSTSGYYWMVDSQKLGINDCNNADATRWRNRYYDADGDTYGFGSLVCVGDHANYVDISGDCCDTDANAKPTQTAWFTTARSGGCSGLAYDYNCDTYQTQQWTWVNGMCEECELVGEEEPECMDVGVGETGWDAISAPACGVPDYYITELGWCEYKCDNYNCVDEYRTQACH